MSFAISTDNEGTIIEGNLSLFPNGQEDGSLEILGTIYTNRVTEYNVGHGIQIINTQNVSGNTTASVVVYGGSSFLKETRHQSFLDLNILNTTNTPSSGIGRFWYDTTGTLKLLNSSGTLTTLSPSTTKGDIVIHNGTTQVRLPIGLDGTVLVADSSQNNGVKWDISNNGTSNGKGGITLIGTNTLTNISDKLIGSFYHRVINKISKGPSANFFLSKSRNNIAAAIARIGNCPGITTNERLEMEWFAHEEPELRKNGSGYDGNYISNDFENNIDTSITLSGTTWQTIFTETIGNFLITITNIIDGPVATFFACKNNTAQNTGSIVRISSSPSSSGTNLQLRWQTNSGIQLRKNANDFDGEYSYFNLIQLSTNISNSVTLSGTTPIEINPKYQRLSTIVSVTSPIINAPYAIFCITKNDRSVSFSVSRIVNSPGITTLETLQLRWNDEESLKLYKTGNGYNGIYDIKIIDT